MVHFSQPSIALSALTPPKNVSYSRTTKSSSFVARIFDRFPPKAIEKASRNVRENAWIPIEEIFQSKNFSAENFEIFHLWISNMFECKIFHSHGLWNILEDWVWEVFDRFAQRVVQLPIMFRLNACFVLPLMHSRAGASAIIARSFTQYTQLPNFKPFACKRFISLTNFPK